MGRDWYRGSAKKDTHSSGCFTAVFHVFDLHRPLFPVTRQSATTGTGSGGYGCFQPHDSIISPQTTVVKGAEAPRNSSETEEEEASSSSFKLQIKTRRSKAGAGDNETCSPGTKTPTLVARLMGLDLLPQNETPSSPSLSSTLNFRHRKSLDGHMGGGNRSSSARRSDMDHHHLSLQINKENMSPTEDLVVSRLSSLKKELKLEEDNRSGRLTVKQVKQSVGSRKVGSDITNKVRKSSTKAQPVNGLHKRQPPKTASRCNEKFSSRLKRQEEPFARPSTVNRVNITDRKCRKTRLSNELGHAKIPQKQVLDAQKPKLGSQLSSCSSQMYKKQEATHVHSDRDDRYKSAFTSIATIAGDKEKYIARVRRRIGSLCSKIRTFPRADCRVLEDIDGLIEKDLAQMKHQSVVAYEEEGEGIVAEIEEEIMEMLLHTAVDFGVRFQFENDGREHRAHG